VVLAPCAVVAAVKVKALRERRVGWSIGCPDGSAAEISGAGFVGIGGFGTAWSQ
jgi:hypothetical protein